MKKFTFKGVLDGFRSSVQPQTTRQDYDFQEQLRSEHFTVKKTFRHGFPYLPTSLAFDPVQRLLAIGDKSGSIRILGRPGVDTHIRHEGESAAAVIHMQFLINEGAIVAVTADDTLHLWDIRNKTPQVVQSLKFQRERITCLSLPVGSKWLYVGTEKGNIHVVHIATFTLSGYIINWNKAIEVVRTSHPGAVIALCDNPIDANKLLIAFECGLLVLWDLKGKFAEIRWQSAEPVKSVSWHYEGKYFVSSHADGAICSWPAKPMPKPQSHVFPHGKTVKEGIAEKCKPIYKVDLKTNRLGETFTIFSGGLPTEKGSKSNCITVMIGKTTTVLEMEHVVLDFITLCENPWSCETQEPFAIAVLLQNDLVLIDLLSPGFPCFESPYPMDLHESPVTCCTYITDCPSDLVPAFYSVGRLTTSKRTGFSDRDWPISGGEWSPASCSYSEIVITGHQDGSLKFWDSGAGALQILYKLKTAKIFEKWKSTCENVVDNPLAVQIISICPESRRMCVAGAQGHVMLFKFRKVETSSEVLVLEIPILFENFDDFYGISPDCELFPQQAMDSNESEKMDNMLRVKLGSHRKPAGFQSQLVCMTTGPNRRNVQITSLCINSSFGLMAYGTEYGLVIIDIIQKVCLFSIACPDLYGAQDPYSRVPKSPKRNDNKDEQTPSSDQLNDIASPEKQSTEFLPETCDVTSSRPISPACALEHTETQRFKKSPTNEDIPVSNVKDTMDRRKSVSWKTFNLKRQLSKVNMKIGINVNADSDIVKQSSSSTFYTQDCERDVNSSPEDANASSPKEDETELNCKENLLNTNASETNSLLRNTKYEQTYDNDAKGHISSIINDNSTLSSVVQNLSDIQIKKSVEFVQEGCEAQVTRPKDLPLFTSETETENVPIKPARQKLKDKRDQRLLSVPNIKYQSRDIRTRSSKSDSSPSFTSNASNRIIMKYLPSYLLQINGGTSGSCVCNFSNKVVVSGSPTERRGNLTNETSNCVCSDSESGSSGLIINASVTAQISSAPSPNISSEEFVPPAVGITNTIISDVGTLISQQQQSTQPVQQYSISSETLRKSKSQDKLDGSFSRSRSSSMSSIDMSSSESVTCLAFIESFTRKNDIPLPLPTLWIGTSFGSILTLLITMPEKEVRKSQPVLVTINGGPTIRLKGSIKSMSFLDALGSIIPYPFELWKDDSKEGKRERTPTKSSSRTSPTFSPTATTSSNSPAGNSSSGTSGSISTFIDAYNDKQYVVVVSEKQTRVLDITNQCCINKIQISDMDFVVKAETVTMKDGSCLAAYLSNGHLIVYSLPSLRVLLDTDFLPLMDLSFQTKCKQGIVDPMLSIWGQQIIVNEDTNHQFLTEMMAELFIPHVMPEQPKESFLKGLFGGGAKNFDREELFGEQSGKANRSVAKHIPGANLEQLGQRASTAASEISRAHQLALERGEKLNLLEERAERMANQAQDFSGTAHQLMLKYKDKKWYQL